MALNLSTLTSPATSGDVLAEALTTADFLEPVPVLRNLARGSQKGGDAKQGTALNQPKALPLIDGEGYLYNSGVIGNYASVPHESGFNLGTQLEIRCKLTCANWTPASSQILVGKTTAYSTSLTSFYLELSSNGKLTLIYNDGSSISSAASTVVTGIPNGATKWIKATLNTNLSGSLVVNYYLSNDGTTYTQLGTSITQSSMGNIHDTTHPITIGHALHPAGYSHGVFLGAVHQVQVFASNNGTSKILDVDFTATNIRHGDTKFKCATGQVVTINQSGNDPATVIKKSVLRFDGTNDGLRGIFANNINGGYMFAAFSVLGTGGEHYGRVFSVQNSTEGIDYASKGIAFALKEQSTNDLGSYYNSAFNLKNDLFDDDNGDILHEVRILNTQHLSKTNNTAALTDSRATSSVDSDTFNICRSSFSNANHGAIDLEFLALFPASITDAQADSVRNYINNRNNVFSLIDSQGYYFFDPQIFPIASPAAFVSYWNGNIVGSDNTLNASVSQSTVNDQPTRDGYKVTFNDNADHLVVASPLSGGQAGWQVVGTSLGTFAYRVNANAVTELNLLGNLGQTAYRKTGDLYGVILLPESATGAHIEAARKLLIDRGAADGVTGSSVENYFRERDDMVEFKGVDFSGVTNFVAVFFGSAALTTFDVNSLPDVTSLAYAFRGSGLTSFHTQLPLVTNASNSFYGSNLESFGVQLPEATRVEYAFYNCSSLSDFTTTDIKKCVNFTSAWQNCSALTSFPAGAKLGTEANNVNFTSAWFSSGLTSFPSDIDLSKGINFANTWRQTALTSFPAIQSTLNGRDFFAAWYFCQNLTSFGAANLNAGKYFSSSWQSCASLQDFAALFANWNPSNIQSGVFNNTWDGCSALTAQSVENILVSIDASGQYATSTGASGGSALGDAGIDIDYNTATGSLSAATDAAIDSLIGKGWQVFINGVLTVPAINNILVLSPAAAYSLRSFDSNDDPNVVNVRRSNDNATSDFTASEVSDGTLVAFVGAGNDGLVTTWYDQGGTNHANQIVASRQPKIVDGGALVTEGGLAALDFDGSNDYLKMTSNVFAENLEVAIVNHLQDGSSSNPRLITLSNGTDDNFMVLHQKSTDYLLLRCHSSEGGATTSSRFGAAGVIDDYNLIYATSKLSSDSYTCSVDGVSQSEVAGPAVGSGSYSISTIGVRSDIFSGSYITGTIQEVIVYDTDQSANRLGIAANINDHFDIYS